MAGARLVNRCEEGAVDCKNTGHRLTSPQPIPTSCLREAAVYRGCRLENRFKGTVRPPAAWDPPGDSAGAQRHEKEAQHESKGEENFEK